MKITSAIPSYWTQIGSLLPYLLAACNYLHLTLHSFRIINWPSFNLKHQPESRLSNIHMTGGYYRGQCSAQVWVWLLQKALWHWTDGEAREPGREERAISDSQWRLICPTSFCSKMEVERGNWNPIYTFSAQWTNPVKFYSVIKKWMQFQPKEEHSWGRGKNPFCVRVWIKHM